MLETTDKQTTVIRTSRGLSIAGTRITLYAILDYLHDDWSPRQIQDWFDLSDQQMTDLMDYITAHRNEVEREYQYVLQRAEEHRNYWEARLHGRHIDQTDEVISVEQQQLRKKLNEWKAQLRQV